MTQQPTINKYTPPAAHGSLTKRSRTDRIIWHCTADPEGRDVTCDDLWRVHVTNNGWSHIGYHYFTQLDGTIWECRPADMVGAHCSGHNSDTIGISYAGGMDSAYKNAKDTRTPEQYKAMYELTAWLLAEHNLGWDDVYGHNEFAAKACPSFDVNDDIAAFLDDQDDTTGEKGDPEPDMPSAGSLGQAYADLEQRLAALEAWRKS